MEFRESDVRALLQHPGWRWLEWQLTQDAAARVDSLLDGNDKGSKVARKKGEVRGIQFAVKRPYLKILEQDAKEKRAAEHVAREAALDHAAEFGQGPVGDKTGLNSRARAGIDDG